MAARWQTERWLDHQAGIALAAEAVAREAELRPTRATISATTRAHEMFRFQEVDNPILLGSGRLDLAFLAVFLLPLLAAFALLAGLLQRAISGASHPRPRAGPSRCPATAFDAARQPCYDT